jgi:formylmethanofuran dehydrogenase subunit E
MDEKELLVIRDVHLQLRDEDCPGPPRFSVSCAACGETVHDRRHVTANGRTLCRHCAGRGYFTVDQK